MRPHGVGCPIVRHFWLKLVCCAGFGRETSNVQLYAGKMRQCTCTHPHSQMPYMYVEFMITLHKGISSNTCTTNMSVVLAPVWYKNSGFWQGLLTLAMPLWSDLRQQCSSQLLCELLGSWTRCIVFIIPLKFGYKGQWSRDHRGVSRWTNQTAHMK